MYHSRSCGSYLIFIIFVLIPTPVLGQLEEHRRRLRDYVALCRRRAARRREPAGQRFSLGLVGCSCNSTIAAIFASNTSKASMVATRTESKHKGCEAASREKRGVAEMWRTMKSLTRLATALLVFSTVDIAQAQVADDPLPAPDTGMQWKVTFDDEFNGTSVDTTKWNGQYGGGLQWCLGAQGQPGGCPQDYDGVTEANGVLTVTSPVDSDWGLNTGGPTAAQAKFSQHYGYFSARVKEPPFGYYDTAPLWFFPIGKFDFPNGMGSQPPDCTTDGNEEIDFGEGYIFRGGDLVIAPDPEHLSFSYHDFCFNNPYSFHFPGNVDTSADFHTYGLLWRNDGSAHGSFTPYFDGVALSAPIPTDPRSMLWDNGVYIMLIMQGPNPGDPHNNNVNTWDWVHAYQEVAGGPTPTPTPTPTATRTPVCSVTISSPVNGATVSNPVSVMASISGCGTDYTKWYLDGSDAKQYGVNPAVFNALSVGMHTFDVQMLKQTTNTLDATAPSITVNRTGSAARGKKKITR